MPAGSGCVRVGIRRVPTPFRPALASAVAGRVDGVLGSTAAARGRGGEGGRLPFPLHLTTCPCRDAQANRRQWATLVQHCRLTGGHMGIQRTGRSARYGVSVPHAEHAACLRDIGLEPETDASGWVGVSGQRGRERVRGREGRRDGDGQDDVVLYFWMGANGAQTGEGGTEARRVRGPRAG